MKRAVTLGRPLSRRFYARPVVVVARAVLGRLLVRDGPDGVTAGWIVETEAYGGAGDPASHAFRGQTRRNATMFGPPGRAYVYFTYGMHHCLNLVAEGEGRAAAVLVRALEPSLGIEVMRARRGGVSVERMARGPGCVAQALGLCLAHDGLNLAGPELWLSDRPARRRGLRVAAGRRIGIRHAVSRPWRFQLAGHAGVSGGRDARSEGPRRRAADRD